MADMLMRRWLASQYHTDAMDAADAADVKADAEEAAFGSSKQERRDFKPSDGDSRLPSLQKSIWRCCQWLRHAEAQQPRYSISDVIKEASVRRFCATDPAGLWNCFGGCCSWCGG